MFWGIKYRRSHRSCSVRKGVLRNFAEFTGKHLRQSLFFNKVAGRRPADLLKTRPWHRCFPGQLLPKILRESYKKFEKFCKITEICSAKILKVFRKHVEVFRKTIERFSTKTLKGVLQKILRRGLEEYWEVFCRNTDVFCKNIERCSAELLRGVLHSDIKWATSL